MKVGTSSLTGKALEYCVIRLERPKLKYGEDFGIHHASDQLVIPSMKEPDCYSPYSGWKYCGPIIERERIVVIPARNGWKYYWAAECGDQEAYESFGPQGDRYDNAFHIDGTHSGEAPLIAAMRCYVASKLGDVVDVPDELMVSS